MQKHMFYTAVGSLQTRKDETGNIYPVIILNQKEYPVDPQELTLWSALCWRLCDSEELARQYWELAATVPVEKRTLENCVTRLEVRGLIAKGVGRTDFEALYDLLSDLYVVPVSEKLSFRIIGFLSLVLLRGVSPRKAAQLFRHDRRNEQEALVMSLSNQAPLSTAELIKCAEVGAEDVSTDEKLLDALYCDDNTTSDNIGMMMLTAQSRQPITMAVANLYLRKQIILERI